MKKIISYIGSKVNLFDFLDEFIVDKFDKNDNKFLFCDLFAGTNSVARHVIQETKWNVITNDLSKYSYILSFYLHFNSLNKKQYDFINKTLISLNNLPLEYNGAFFNELSAEGIPSTIDEDKIEEMFSNQPYNSRMFFSKRVGAKIDVIKKELKRLRDNTDISITELNILITFLIFYVDKNANTTSVYGAYLKNEKKMEKEKDFYDNELVENFKTLTLDNSNGNKLISLNTNIVTALQEVGKINPDNSKNIIYLDPPYNSRSYESNYHILEYVADLDFSTDILKRNSKTAQYIQKNKNPFASKNLTAGIFKDMITEAIKISNNTFISYNTDGLMKQADIENIFEELKVENENLKLHTYKTTYRRFKASTNPEIKKVQQAINREQNAKNITELKIKLKELNSLHLNSEKTENVLEEIIWHFEVKQ